MIFVMGILKFGLLCIDFLAWPTIALAYPLCASIRAIESGSKYHMRKLVTYWTVLSLISLFEHTLRVMEWVPFWPYIKLIATFWLVIPQFNGACYAYDRLVCADLGEKLLCILSHFSPALHAYKHFFEDIKAMEQRTEQGTGERKSEDIKAMEQTTEQGTGERKSEDIKAIEQRTEQGTGERKSEDIKAMEQTTEQGTGERKSEDIKAIEQRTEQGTGERKSMYIKAMEQTTEQGTEERNSIYIKAMEQTTEQGTEDIKVKSAVDNIGEIQKKETAEVKIIPEINSSKLIQREWTCAVCQVTCNSEYDLKSHLGGNRHRTKCAELKSIKRVTKDTGSSSSSSSSSSLKATNLPNQIKKQETKRQVKENNVGVGGDSRLYCSICSIWCSDEVSLASHLKGRKHVSMLKKKAVLLANELAKRAPSGEGSKEESNVKPQKATNLRYQVKNEPTKHGPEKNNKEKENNASVSTSDPRVYCSLCNIKAPNEASLVAHLKGKKHLSKLKHWGF